MWYAVYVCGPTDCWLDAIFRDPVEAEVHRKRSSEGREPGHIEVWTKMEDVNFTDTGLDYEHV